jgi:hypothetical protein
MEEIFFASNGIEVEALDYSAIAVEILGKVTKKKRLPITPQLFDVTQPLPFPYSHMLLNMRFSLEDLHFIFSEINRVLKPKAFNFQNDKSYGSGLEVDRGIYEINGFQIRFFTKKEIDDLATAEGFKILWMKEEYEEPVTLFLVSSKKAYIVIGECELV